MVHASGSGGGEEPGVTWVLGVLLGKQVHRLLWNGDLADGVLCLWPRYDEIVICVLGGLLIDGDGPLLHVQVCPLQGLQLTFRIPLTNPR